MKRVVADLLCAVSGHEWSWVYAISIGVEDRPVCRRCGRARA